MSHNYTMDDATNALVDSIMNKAIKQNLKIATAESCTGGMLASTLINFAGASKAYQNGFVTYTNESKAKLLGVKEETLDAFGAVSYQTAEEMCAGAAKRSNVEIGLSTTGVAGPDGGTPDKPVGLVYIGIYLRGRVYKQRLLLSGDRLEIRSKTVVCILELLNKLLSDKED